MEKIASILAAGVQAPSADNDHVFRFEVDGQQILLWPSHGAPSDWKGHERSLALLSLGAVVENMVLRSAGLGLCVTIDLLPADCACWLRLQLQDSAGAPVGCVNPVLDHAIEARHTNRGLFSREQLGPDVREMLAAASSDGVGVSWLDGRNRSQGLRLVYQAECARFASRFLHSELFSSIRFDKGWKDAVDHRLAPATLAIEPPMRPFFKMLRHWGFARVLRSVGLHKLIGVRAALLPAWFSGGVGVVTVPKNRHGDEAWFSAGRAFERVWLRAAAAHLALQPLAASAVLQGLLPDADPESVEVVRHLREGWECLFPDDQVMMVFRVGVAGEAPIRSGRLPVSHYLRC